MLRKLLTGAVIVAGVLALAVPAHAKGEGGKITIKESGGGGIGTPFGWGSRGGGGGSSKPLLSSPIVITGEQSAFWFEATGFGQAKYEKPITYGGALPLAKLGPALDVRASFLCGPHQRGAVHQTLYPYAPGGPQTYTPAGQGMCGMALRQGWWGSTYTDMFDKLVAAGLPRHAPLAATNAAAGSASTSSAVQHDDRTAWPLIVAGALALTLLLVSGAVVQRRRVRVRVPA